MNDNAFVTSLYISVLCLTNMFLFVFFNSLQQHSIHFNDTLTSTFEYPSESSILLDDSTLSENGDGLQQHQQMSIGMYAG